MQLVRFDHVEHGLYAVKGAGGVGIAGQHICFCHAEAGGIMQRDLVPTHLHHFKRLLADHRQVDREFADKEHFGGKPLLVEINAIVDLRQRTRHHHDQVAGLQFAGNDRVGADTGEERDSVRDRGKDKTKKPQATMKHAAIYSFYSKLSQQCLKRWLIPHPIKVRIGLGKVKQPCDLCLAISFKCLAQRWQTLR